MKIIKVQKISKELKVLKDAGVIIPKGMTELPAFLRPQSA